MRRQENTMMHGYGYGEAWLVSQVVGHRSGRANHLKFIFKKGAKKC